MIFGSTLNINWSSSNHVHRTATIYSIHHKVAYNENIVCFGDYWDEFPESERSCICVLEVSIVSLSTILVFDFRNCSDGVIYTHYIHIVYVQLFVWCRVSWKSRITTRRENHVESVGKTVSLLDASRLVVIRLRVVIRLFQLTRHDTNSCTYILCI